MSGDLSTLERVIAKNPTSSLFARLADGYLRRGDPHRAIEICRQGLRYRPSYVSGHVVLGKSQFSAGMYEEARRSFNKALHLDPNHIVAIWYLGRIDRTLGWDDLALRNFQKARDLDPLSPALQEAIEEVLASISNQVGQKIRDEVNADDPREGYEAGPETGQAPAVPGQPDSGDRRESGANGTPSPQDDGAMEPGEGPPLTTGLPSRSAAGPPGAPPQPDPDTETGMPDDPEERDAATKPSTGRIGGRSARAGDSDPKAKGGAVWETLPIATVTLAEICAAQGHTAQAVAILERLLREDPGDERVRERLRSLRPPASEAAAT